MSAVPYNGYGMPQMGRRNQRRAQLPVPAAGAVTAPAPAPAYHNLRLENTAPSENSAGAVVKPVLPAGGVPYNGDPRTKVTFQYAGRGGPMIPQTSMDQENAIELNAGRRANLVNQATSQARAGALKDARGTQGYQTGASSLDKIRAAYGVNEEGISPEEANARRTRMFADAEYKNASQQVGTALQPITMAGYTAGNEMKTALAETKYLYPGYFQDRQNAMDANNRANEANAANVGVANANAGLTNEMAHATPGMTQAQIAQMNAGSALTNAQATAYPGMTQAQIAQMQSKGRLDEAQAGKVGAETGRIKDQTDAPTLGVAAQAQGSKQSEAKVKELEKMILDLQTKLAGYGQAPESKGKGKGKYGNAASGDDGTGGEQGQYQVGQQRRHKATGRLEAWNGSNWVAQ